MKVCDIKKICEKPFDIIERGSFAKYVELPCLDACLYLYDMNIKIYSAGCNKVNCDNAHIILFYNLLSPENKQIADNLVSNNIASKSESNYENFITISIPSKSSDDVKIISNKLLTIVKYFHYQDLQYGYTTKEEFMKKYFESGKEFKYINNELVPINKDRLTKDELEEKKISILYEFNELFEDLVDEGCVDLENDLVWENAELLQKHIEYIEKEKGRGSK